jgi:hypothetical protein
MTEELKLWFWAIVILIGAIAFDSFVIVGDAQQAALAQCELKHSHSTCTSTVFGK